MPEGSEPPRFLAAGSTLTTNILRCTALLPVAAQNSVMLCVGPALLVQQSVNIQNLSKQHTTWLSCIYIYILVIRRRIIRIRHYVMSYLSSGIIFCAVI